MSKKVSPFSKAELLPQVERLEVKKGKGALHIGIPKETSFEEKRICLTPDAVASLTSQGHDIVIETGAGEGANFPDSQYAEAGATIVYNAKEVFNSTVILKVEPLSTEEIKLIKPQSILFSALQLKTQKKSYFQTLSKKRITAIAFDYIKDNHGVYPILRSLGEITGTASILIAAELMSNKNKGNGLLLGNIGGVAPSEVVILGAGTVGECAARAALGLGASVKMFDNAITRLRNVQHTLSNPIYTSTIQQKTLAKALESCDVVIGALRGQTRTPVVVSEAMVSRMKENAVLVDVSIDRGGCFETSEVTTHSNPVYKKYGVLHYCVPNIPSRYSRTASVSISNFFTPFLLEIGDEGGFENALEYDKTLRSGMYFYHGVITNKVVADWFGLPFRDINLLMI